jgi:hypothetical protein
MTPGIFTNGNNIITETHTVHLEPGQGSGKIQVTRNNYKYNAIGYPESMNGNVVYLYG